MEDFNLCQFTLNHARILVAEDNADFRCLIHFILSQEGVDVTFADDGVEALKFLKEKEFDLVLLDLTLPWVSGLEVMCRLKDSGFLGRIVALSAYPESLKRNECLESGFDDYIAKPFQGVDEFKRRLIENLS